MVGAGVAIGILAGVLSLGLGVFMFLLERRGRTRAEQAHWARWESECLEFGCHDETGDAVLYDWEERGWL